MKTRYAVSLIDNDDQDVLCFNIQRGDFLKGRQFVKQEKGEGDTVQAFENKYAVKCEWNGKNYVIRELKEHELKGKGG